MARYGMENVAANILREGIAGTAFAAGSTGTRMALDPEYRPDGRELGKDLAVDFAFSVLTSTLSGLRASAKSKARLQQYGEELARGYGEISGSTDLSATLNALDGLTANSAQLRLELGNQFLPGQQREVDAVNRFLDQLDESLYNTKAGLEQGAGNGGGPQLGGKWSAPELPMSPAMAFSALGGGKAPDAEVKAWTDAGWTDAEGPSVRGPEVAESVDIPGESGIIDLEDYFDDPKKFAEKTPEQLYKDFVENGVTVQPLSRGDLEGILFEDGGGFKINWGGDRILQYHPAGRNHHGGGAYFKLSSGATGKMWFDIYGNSIPRP